MATFAPDIPESQEPNYLRYSRPSNFAPVNKGPGELIKTVGEGFAQGMKATDSVVNAGISSYVQSKGSAISEDYIHGQLEPEFQRVTGVDPRTGQKSPSLLSSYADEAPKDIKDLPGKIDAMSAYKAKGGFVPTEYQSKVEALSKDLKSKYPSYSSTIEQQVSRFTGDRPATAYVSQLLAGIHAAESNIENEKKRKENIVDTFTKEGNISPVLRAAYDQGKVSMDYMINQGTITAYQKKNLELDTMRNNNKESEIKLTAVTAGHHADGARDIFLARTMKDVSVANGTETTPKFIQYKNALDSGKKQYLTPDEQQQFSQSMELGKQRFLSTYNQHMISSGLAEKMGSEEYTKKMKEAGDAFDLYHGMSNPKDYVQQHSFQKWMETKTEGTRMAIELSPTMEKLRRIEMVQKMSPLNIVISQRMTDATNAIPNLDKDLHSFVYDKLIDSVTGAPTNGAAPPSAHTDINKLNELGYKGDAHQQFLNFSEMISDPKTPTEAKKNLVDYFFAGDGAKLLPQFLKEDRYAATQNYNGMSLMVKQGRFSAWNQLINPKIIDAAYELGGQSWQTTKDFVDKSTRTMLGSEIKDLNGLAERGYKFSWDSKNNELTIKQGSTVAHPMSPQDMRINRAQNRPGVPTGNQETVHAVNEVLKGIKNVAAKQPGIDVNAYVLDILTKSGLDKDNPAAKAIMDAIIASHSAPMPANVPTGKEKM